MGQLPEKHSRPDLEFVGEAPIRSSDEAYSERAKRNFKSVSERVATVKAEQSK